MLWAAGLPVGVARAQDQPAPASMSVEEERDDARRGQRSWARMRPIWSQRERGLSLSRQLFELLPEDRGPLQEGEEEVLLAFAREQMPHFYRLIVRLRERHPDRYRAKLREHAPHLRRMKRVFEHNPDIGRIIQRHAENMFNIRREARQLRSEPEGSPLYESALQRIRERMTENVQLEIAALRAFGRELKEEGPNRARRFVEDALKPDAQLAALPPRARRLADAYREAETSEAREAARKQLEESLRRFMKVQLESIRRQVAEMHERAVEEVDDRVQRVVDAVRRDRGGHRGDHRGEGRGRRRR
jgi:hypothetical protein